VVNVQILEVPASDRVIPADVRAAVIARDGMICQLCGCAVVRRTLHLDHVLHWASGGEHTLENLRVTCARCNLTRPGPSVVIRRVIGCSAPRELTGAAARRHHRRLVAAGLVAPRPCPDLHETVASITAEYRRSTARQRRALDQMGAIHGLTRAG